MCWLAAYGATPRPADAAGLVALAEAAGERCLRGVLMYAGDQLLPLGQRIWAVPLGAVGLEVGADSRAATRRMTTRRRRSDAR